MMSEPIHGHEVMQMMIDTDNAYTKESLRAAMIEKFGEDARYYTCSAENMTPDELIEFLAARGKFSEESDGFKTDPDKICDH